MAIATNKNIYTCSIAALISPNKPIYENNCQWVYSVSISVTEFVGNGKTSKYTGMLEDIQKKKKGNKLKMYYTFSHSELKLSQISITGKYLEFTDSIGAPTLWPIFLQLAEVTPDHGNKTEPNVFTRIYCIKIKMSKSVLISNHFSWHIRK